MATPPAISSHRRPASAKARAWTAAAIVLMFGLAVLAGVKLATRSSEAAAAPIAPGTTSGASTDSRASAPVGPATVASAVPARYVFPVGSPDAAYAHTHEEYPAADILAPCGTPVVAVTDGVVLEVNRIDRWDPITDDGAWRGGRFLSILGDDGVRYYGGHFSVLLDFLAPGVRVAAGQQVGLVGTTGKSGACHLHFGISPPCGRVGDWWNRRGVIWPWPYLDAWRAGTPTSAVPEITAWRGTHGCPTAPDPALP